MWDIAENVEERRDIEQKTLNGVKIKNREQCNK